MRAAVPVGLSGIGMGLVLQNFIGSGVLSPFLAVSVVGLMGTALLMRAQK